jgi:hypothetical protein
VKIRWFRSPLYLHLVPIGYAFGISLVHIRNFFIATDVLLRKKPFQYEHRCFLAARGGTKSPVHAVCDLGTEYSPRLTVDC